MMQGMYLIAYMYMTLTFMQFIFIASIKLLKKIHIYYKCYKMLFDRICQSSVGKIVYYYSVKSKQVEKLL